MFHRFKILIGLDDYRTLDQRQKVLAQHPERQLTKADLPGGYVTPSESAAYNAWWNKTHGSERQPSFATPVSDLKWGTAEKTALQRDQEMYDKMHKESDQCEKTYREKHR